MQNIIIGICVVAVIIWSILKGKKDDNIRKNGIVADAVISRVQTRSGTRTSVSDNPLMRDQEVDTTEYTYFVRFRLQGGQEVEAKLGEPVEGLPNVGDPIRIQYLPGKMDYVLIPHSI